MPRAKPARSQRRAASTRPSPAVAPGTATEEIGDRFFREMVWSLRNGVLAITRDGRVAVFNDIAYQTLDLEPGRGNLGRPYSEVLANSHDIARILDGAFKLTHLPNRAELRLASGKVIGYTLSLVKDTGAETVGAALFFKDLTRVEQLEERERLRDRLAALGEMAAAIAHEVKNPLAGIEVMAGVLKRQLDSEDAQQILSDIITEAKMANAIVQEVLEFVRPIQLQVEPVPLGRVLRDAVGMAESQIDPRSTSVSVSVPDSLPDLSSDPHQLRQLFTNLLTNAFEALDRRGQVEVKTWLAAEDSRRTSVEELAVPSRPLMVEVATTGRACLPTSPTRSSARSSRRSHGAAALAWRSSERSSMRTTGASMWRADQPVVPASGSRCRSRASIARLSRCSRVAIRTPAPARMTKEDEPMGRILVADDHDSLRRGISRALTEAGHEVEQASDGNAAIERLHGNQFDIVLSDLKMGGSDGLDVLRTARKLQPTAAVILMTAFGSVQTAVEALKIGAFDYVQKPFEIEEMESKIEKALELRRLRHEVDYLRHTQSDIYEFSRIVGASGALQRVLDLVRKVSQSNTTVLIRGETGTGKELIAGALHHNSPRSARNFVKVNCAALPENLLESELFGHEKGAFTSADRQRVGRFEQADGGSILLDEVGDMSPNTQAKILRVLQEQEFERLGSTRTLHVDVRVIAATNRNLANMVADGTFREDLYYRLNVVMVEMPPLRERKDDIVELAQFFIRRSAAELKKKIDGLDPAAERLLKRYAWPGNIRELENAIERAVLLTDGPYLLVEDLRLGELAVSGNSQEVVLAVNIPPTGIALEEIERQAVVEALRMSNWVQKDAAELLSISPRVMNYKIKTLGIELPRGRRATSAPAAMAG